MAVRKENNQIKGVQIGKEVKLILDADDMILVIENPKDATRRLLELSTNLVKFQDIKSTHRNLAFLYTNNERA